MSADLKVMIKWKLPTSNTYCKIIIIIMDLVSTSVYYLISYRGGSVGREMPLLGTGVSPIQDAPIPA